MQQEDRSDFAKMDIRTVQADTLQDIKNVMINPELSVDDRMKEFVRQIKNPYFFRCGKLIVQIEYSDTDRTIQDCIKEYIEGQLGE